jgi:hypothetical protein
MDTMKAMIPGVCIHEGGSFRLGKQCEVVSTQSENSVKDTVYISDDLRWRSRVPFPDGKHNAALV